MIRVYEILISLAVIVLVTWLGDRFRGLAGVLATMPLNIPLAMMIVFHNTGRDPEATVEFARASVKGIVATGSFVLAAWLVSRRRSPFALVILAGYAAWAATLLLWYGFEWLWARGGG